MGFFHSWVYLRSWSGSLALSDPGDFGTYEEVAAVDTWARVAARDIIGSMNADRDEVQ